MKVADAGQRKRLPNGLTMWDQRPCPAMMLAFPRVAERKPAIGRLWCSPWRFGFRQVISDRSAGRSSEPGYRPLVHW
jgi:hypothetical protein